MTPNKPEVIDKLLDNDKLREIDKLRFDYAWKWFDFHAKQRMQLFNFFLIITGILASAYASAFEKSIPLMSFAVGLIGFLQAFGFLIFDIRSRELTRYAEDILEKLENDQLFPDNFRTFDGKALGLIRQESKSKMREGFTRERKWKNLLKMKVWIRSIEVIVGLAFFIGLSVAISQIASNRSLTTKSTGSNHGENISNSSNQSSANSNSSVSPTKGAK